ncbi:MAG: hypothetical protein QMD50_03290 [Patescibacteria group bacterium]|nr:hypothetical protein [Patescibacteria group bacterium]
MDIQEDKNNKGQQISGSQEELVVEQMPIGWPWRLLIFTIIVFALSLFIYFGLRFGYGAYLDTASKNLDKDIKTLSDKVPPADREEFIRFYSQIINLKTVLDNHPYGSNIFKFLEKNTIGSIYFTSAEMSVSSLSLKLNGFGKDFESVAQQMALLEKASEVERVFLDQVNVQKEGVTFSLFLDFKREFIKKPLL